MLPGRKCCMKSPSAVDFQAEKSEAQNPVPEDLHPVQPEVLEKRLLCSKSSGFLFAGLPAPDQVAVGSSGLQN